MKAKRIYENINFERGQDPKVAMGVGKSANPIEILSIGEEVNDNGPIESEKDLEDSDGNSWFDTLGEDDALYLLNNWEDRKHNNYEFWIRSDSNDEDFDILFPYDLQEEWIIYNGHKFYIPKQTKLYKAGFVKESLDFERGNDPKTAMGIGRLENIYIKVKEDNWDKNPDPNSALGWASEKGNIEDVKFLIEIGADPASDDYDAINVALLEQNYEILDILIPLIDIEEFKKYIDDEDELYTELLINYYQQKYINESLEFEREKEPLDALGIGRLVKVKGDRGYGDYTVRLLDRYEGSDLMEDEEVWKAQIIKNTIIKPIVYVVKYAENSIAGRKAGSEFWGEIDPFINVNESIGFERGKDPKSSMKIGMNEKLKPFNLNNIADNLGIGNEPIKKLQELLNLSSNEIFLLGFIVLDLEDSEKKPSIKNINNILKNIKRPINYKTKSPYKLYHTKIGNIVEEHLAGTGIWYWGDINSAKNLDIINYRDEIID